MEFGILGPLLVRDEAGARSVPAAKQRILLAALLLRRGQLVPTDSLADIVWDGRPPRSAATTLRNYVMRLRRVLGAAGERLETGTGGYLLNVDPAELDAQRFAELRDLGQQALRRGELEHARALLDRASTLWRGPVLVDVASDVLRHEEAGRLTEIRLDICELRLETALRLGQHSSAIAELRGLTSRHPERERFWAQLMTALYRSGRQSEALTVYRGVRRSLAEEMGVEPGIELREVHQRILRGEPDLVA